LSIGWFDISDYWFALVFFFLYFINYKKKGSVNNMAITLGERIKNYRIDAGLTLPELARKSDITKGYLWQLEEGKTQNPSLDTLSKIANALDKTIAEITKGEPLIKPVKGKAFEIPPSLSEFIEEQKKNSVPLTNDEIEMLANIHYRGKRPSSKQDWLTLYSVIMMVSKKKTASSRATRKK
jgi:transcriptional regulator with XRE-family HTH domain